MKNKFAAMGVLLAVGLSASSAFAAAVLAEKYEMMTCSSDGLEIKTTIEFVGQKTTDKDIKETLQTEWKKFTSVFTAEQIVTGEPHTKKIGDAALVVLRSADDQLKPVADSSWDGIEPGAYLYEYPVKTGKTCAP